MGQGRPVTALLRRWRGGDEAAHAELVELVYPELSTALVHEACLHLADAEVPWQDRAHFFAVAARIMRHILETAEVLHTSPTTVNRELRFAEAWLTTNWHVRNERTGVNA